MSRAKNQKKIKKKKKKKKEKWTNLHYYTTWYYSKFIGLRALDNLAGCWMWSVATTEVGSLRIIGFSYQLK